MIMVVDICFPTRVYLGLYGAEPNSRTGLGITVTRRAACSFVNSVRYRALALVVNPYSQTKTLNMFARLQLLEQKP